jgi:S1-C subfamily serine protease
VYFIQVDAAINPGISRGALIKTKGHIFSMNSALYPRSSGIISFGFICPSTIPNR